VCYADPAMAKGDTKRSYVAKQMLDQAVEAILKGVEGLFEDQNKRYDKRFDQVDQRLDKLEAGQSDLKRQLTDLKLDAPTRKEFNDLKERVDRYHPL
jgi:chromosome segregation ATPase